MCAGENNHQFTLNRIHSLTDTHTQVHEREKERKSHTHRDRQTDRMFIPYFSETETSGDIISDRERERDSVEERSETEKKIVFHFLLLICVKSKQTEQARRCRDRFPLVSACV